MFIMEVLITTEKMRNLEDDYIVQYQEDILYAEIFEREHRPD